MVFLLFVEAMKTQALLFDAFIGGQVCLRSALSN